MNKKEGGEDEGNKTVVKEQVEEKGRKKDTIRNGQRTNERKW